MVSRLRCPTSPKAGRWVPGVFRPGGEPSGEQEVGQFRPVSRLEQGREGRSLPTAACPQAPSGAAQRRSLRSPCRCSACGG